jgi:hypothetical protein
MMMRWISLMVAAVVTAGLRAQEKRRRIPRRARNWTRKLMWNCSEKTRRRSAKEWSTRNAAGWKTGALFWPVYEQYAGEQKQLDDQKLAIIQDYAKNFMTMDDAKADELA